MRHYDREDFLDLVYKNEIDSSKFTGTVLYLGMGSAWLPRKQVNVNKTIIVEYDEKIINLYEHFAKGCEIIYADAYKYNPKEKFNHIVLDIWDRMTDYSVVAGLLNRYEDYLKPNGKLHFLRRIVRSHTIPTEDKYNVKENNIA